MGEPPPSLIPLGAPECHRSPFYIARVTVPSTINPFRVVLRHRNFRLFWIGQTLSLIGTWMQTMAQGWLALELTNSAFLVGLVATAASIPILLFTMPAGAIVDRSDKLRIVRIAQMAFIVEASTLWALTVTRHITIEWLLAVSYTHLRAHETPEHLVCRLLLEK